MIKTRKFKKNKFNKISRRGKKYKARQATMRQKNRKRVKRRKRSRKMRGGEAIAAGSVGCIFKPALKCTDKDTDAKDTRVSKLMIKSEAEKEIKEVKAIADVLSEVGNNYFIIAQESEKCDLSYSLNEEDLVSENSKKKCKEIFAKDANWNNFSLLNMPYGGNNLQKWLDNSGTLSNENFQKINKLLIELLEKAIVPMNEKNVFHLDIKTQNLVYDDQSSIRIIDWGYARKFEPETNKIPQMYTEQLYYAVPFGFLFFYPDIYTKTVVKYDFKYLQDLKSYLNDDTKLNEYINEHLKMIREKYNNNDDGRFKYFSEVFSKNADIWGFLCMYIKIYEKIQDDNIKQNIIKLIDDYILNSNWAVKAYNVCGIMSDLKNLANDGPVKP